MAGAVAALFLLAAATLTAPSAAHNITTILNEFPDYSLYNQYLTDTHVADEINTRETVTTLVLTNAVTSALTANQTLPAIKNALLLLTLLDYFDLQKLQSLPAGSILTTTLLQTTGAISGLSGSVNITDYSNGIVTFSPATPDFHSVSNFTKSVKQLPYNISVLEVSGPLLFPGLMGEVVTATNLTAVLYKAGCKIFAKMLVGSGVMDMYQAAMEKGLTVLAPNDEAFTENGLPDLKALSKSDLVSVLMYHAIPSYAPKAALKVAGGGIRTMASGLVGKFEISTVTKGDEVKVVTGVVSSRIASTVLDASPDCVMTVDSVLLPVEIFGKAPPPALVPPPPPAPLPSPPPMAPPAVAPTTSKGVGVKPVAWVVVAAVVVALVV